MITIAPHILSMLQAGTIRTFYLVKIQGLLNTTDFSMDISFNSETYWSDSRLVNIEPPQLSSVVDRELYKLVLADPDMSLSPTVEANLVGKQVSVWLGLTDFLTQATTLVCSPSNSILIYRGQVDSASYSYNTTALGEALLTIACASPVADLDMKKPFWTSKEFIETINPGDRAFDLVNQGSAKINLRWGKA
jgi:hypothetical protein